MSAQVGSADVERFYRAATLGLGVLEGRAAGGRRFGADADARWNAFRGGLSDWHRLDLLVRDAAVRHPAGFAPRVVFDLPALADDEPCGPDWPGPSPSEASSLLRAGAAGARDVSTALAGAAAAWGLSPQELPPSRIADIGPATRLLIAGAGAVVSAAKAFAGRTELDLADQSVLMADDPGMRQVFGLALAFLDDRQPPRLVRSSASAADLRGLGFHTADRLLVSDDASPALRDAAAALARDIGLPL
jgi:hypothetical protein